MSAVNRQRSAYKARMDAMIKDLQRQINDANQRFAALQARRGKIEKDMLQLEKNMQDTDVEYEKARVLVEDLSQNMRAMMDIQRGRGSNRNNGENINGGFF